MRMKPPYLGPLLTTKRMRFRIPQVTTPSRLLANTSPIWGLTLSGKLRQTLTLWQIAKLLCGTCLGSPLPKIARARKLRGLERVRVVRLRWEVWAQMGFKFGHGFLSFIEYLFFLAVHTLCCFIYTRHSSAWFLALCFNQKHSSFDFPFEYKKTINTLIGKQQ